MYTVMGITGQVGGVVGHALLAANQQVRAVVRDADKGRAWADRGCEVALATVCPRCACLARPVSRQPVKL